MEKIKFKKHKTIQSLLKQYYNFEKAEDFSLKDIGEIGLCDGAGKEFTITIQDEIDNWKQIGYWGFADSNTRTVHYWVTPTIDKSELLFFFAHEIGHLSGKQYKNELREEMRADSYAFAATLALKIVNRIKKEKDLPQLINSIGQIAGCGYFSEDDKQEALNQIAEMCR